MSSLEIDEIIAAEVESGQMINQAHMEAITKLEESKRNQMKTRNQVVESAVVDSEQVKLNFLKTKKVFIAR